MILIDSVFRTGNNYYSQVFLEECKYVVKKKKMPKYIIVDIEISSDSDRENSDEENSDEENFDEEKSGEENSNEESSNKENLKNTYNLHNSYKEKTKYFLIIFFLYIKNDN